MLPCCGVAVAGFRRGVYSPWTFQQTALHRWIRATRSFPHAAVLIQRHAARQCSINHNKQLQNALVLQRSSTYTTSCCKAVLTKTQQTLQNALFSRANCSRETMVAARRAARRSNDISKENLCCSTQIQPAVVQGCKAGTEASQLCCRCRPHFGMILSACPHSTKHEPAQQSSILQLAACSMSATGMPLSLPRLARA